MSEGRVAVGRHGEHLMAALPVGRDARFAATAEAFALLQIEDRILRLMRAHRDSDEFSMSTTSPDDRSICPIVPRTVGGDDLVVRVGAGPDLVTVVARTLTEALAEQHIRILAADVTGGLPTIAC